MFGALRRCPASIPKNAALLASFPRALRKPLLPSTNSIRLSASRLNNTPIASFHISTRWQQVAAAQPATESAQHDVITEFHELAERNLVHKNIIDAITKKMKITTMTEVQTRTINEGLNGTDIIAQAKTGTGKTLGFLVPVIQRIINGDARLGERSRGPRAKPDDIRAIVISPTRELAEQIAVEAKRITLGTGIVVQTAVGGTQKRMMLMKTQREGCHLMIGTPGRIHDILSDPYSGVKAPKLTTLVMDEADRLLDDGFTKELDEIKKYLPDPDEVDRQTLMFSATIPREVVHLVRETLKPGFHFANCVDENEAPTHKRVPQKLVRLAGFENAMPALCELISKQLAASKSGEAPPFKAIVYFNSTAEVTLSASVLYKLSRGFNRNTPLSGLATYEIHSKLTQAQRTRAANDFRAAKSGILVSSDVTARGMDFPNVTHVIQIGLPRERDTYIHRIGRTGRAGKEGEGWLFATSFDMDMLHRRLRGLDLTEDVSLEAATVDLTAEAELPENVSDILKQSLGVYRKANIELLDAAFRALFGAFQGVDNKHQLVEAANRLATIGWGMETAPPPPASLFSGRSGSRGSFGSGRDGGGYGGRQRSGGFGGDRQRPGGFGGDRQRSGGFGGSRRGSERFGGSRRESERFGGDRKRFGDFDGDRGQRSQRDFY